MDEPADPRATQATALETPRRRGPVRRLPLLLAPAVGLALGLGAGWLLFGSGDADDWSNLWGVVATVDDEAIAGIAGQSDGLAADRYRLSAISDLAVAASVADPELPPAVRAAGDGLRISLARQEYDAVAEDLATLREQC